MLGGGPDRLVSRCWGRVFREHRGDAGEMVIAAFEALKTVIRLDGSGNGLAHQRTRGFV